MVMFLLGFLVMSLIASLCIFAEENAPTEDLADAWKIATGGPMMVICLFVSAIIQIILNRKRKD